MENVIQKINKIGHYLNISSESFMLFALVCIFAIPFVIAKSIEPAVQTDNSSNIAYIYVPVNNTNTNLAANSGQGNTTENSQNQEISDNNLASNAITLPNVLGLILENNNVIADQASQSLLKVNLVDEHEYMFDKFEYSVTSEEEYRLRISSGKQMDGIEILRVVNSSTESRLFSVDVRSFSGDIQFIKLKVGDVAINISDVVWPQYFTIEPTQEVSIFFSYSSVKPFDIDIQIKNY
ncbi:MAG: hypothetical protein N3A71_01220 [Candidatus Dojkabacteria bacterium]|nr:hypothetical protein [Candidatus Dojkabacteria bacterium]